MVYNWRKPCNYTDFSCFHVAMSMILLNGLKQKLIFTMVFIVAHIVEKYNNNINLLKEAYKELTKVHNELNKTSIRDEMTGRYNRNYVK